tara:strand:- start:671 stop:787 length:117 start_codon:yes stop_codon:yes gene_type:complete
MEDTITYTEGDGIKIFYKNGIYYKYQLTNQNEYKRETK